MTLTADECRALAALSSLPEREDFWNVIRGWSQYQPVHALQIIQASEKRGWKWSLDNRYEEEGYRWWTVSITQPQAGLVSLRVDKVRCSTFAEAVARAALEALKEK